IEPLGLRLEQRPEVILPRHCLHGLDALEGIDEAGSEAARQTHGVFAGRPAHGDETLQAEDQRTARGQSHQRYLPGYERRNDQINDDLEDTTEYDAGLPVGVRRLDRFAADTVREHAQLLPAEEAPPRAEESL